MRGVLIDAVEDLPNGQVVVKYTSINGEAPREGPVSNGLVFDNREVLEQQRQSMHVPDDMLVMIALSDWKLRDASLTDQKQSRYCMCDVQEADMELRTELYRGR